MVADKVWLRDGLVQALGWDASVAEEVVEAIIAAQTQKERDDIVQGYLGGGPKVKALVAKFVQGSQPLQVTGTAANAKGREHRPGERQAGSVTIRHVQGRQGAGRAQGPSGKKLPEKEVCNCIGCGKIYFTRAETADNAIFLESGGKCTFCGAQVSLTPGVPSQSRAAQSPGSLPSQEDRAGQRDQDAAAVAFKDRLVDYDRNARQRTTVVDDQNDFFEIDTNAWLDPEEREQLKRQELEMREAEEARRKRVTVTLDLLGRQVLLADEAQPTHQALLSAHQSAAAAKATAAEKQQGGGTAAKAALQAVSRITPNTALKTERPIFVSTTPETVGERQQRRGMPPTELATREAEPQSVVGGWGDEKASTSRGSGLSTDEARLRKVRAHRQSEAPQQRELGEHKQQLSAKKAKRPQLKRLQHDDPFQALDMLALDDSRTEDILAV